MPTSMEVMLDIWEEDWKKKAEKKKTKQRMDRNKVIYYLSVTDGWFSIISFVDMKHSPINSLLKFKIN